MCDQLSYLCQIREGGNTALKWKGYVEGEGKATWFWKARGMGIIQEEYLYTLAL